MTVILHLEDINADIFLKLKVEAIYFQDRVEGGKREKISLEYNLLTMWNIAMTNLYEKKRVLLL